MERRKGMVKPAIACIIFVALGVASGYLAGQCTGSSGTGDYDTISVRRDTVRDTVIVRVRETMPQAQAVRKTGSAALRIPLPKDTCSGDSTTDSATVTLPVVQKIYARDSLYMAWVSGIGHGDYPRLDSIHVLQPTVSERVSETVTVRQRPGIITFGLQAGYGYGFRSGMLEPYVGVGLTLRFPWKKKKQ